MGEILRANSFTRVYKNRSKLLSNAEFIRLTIYTHIIYVCEGLINGPLFETDFHAVFGAVTS